MSRIAARVLRFPAAWMPWIAAAIWLADGGWGEAGFQARNWIVFASVLSIGASVSCPDSGRGEWRRRTMARLAWAGWIVIAGLVALES